MTEAWAVPLLLAVPLAWVVLSMLVPVSWRAGLGVLGILVQSVLTLQLWLQVAALGSQHYFLGNWSAPLGIDLRVDGLATLFVVMTTVISAVAGIYAWRYLRKYPHAQTHFWPLFWFLWAALNGIWLSADLFNLYVGLELLGLASVGLVALSRDRAALAAALRYLFAALLGSLAYLLGVALIYGAYGTLDTRLLAESLAPGMTTAMAFALIAAGLLFKTALFPLHSWLPPAHGGALAPVSAILSALVVKASFYILARLWLITGAEVTTTAAAQGLGVLGACAIFWGGWKACRAMRLKMVIAYSTVAQLGYLFLLFPLALGTSAAAATLAWDGAVLQVLSHALAKAAMFLAAGNLILALGRDHMDNLAGVSRFLPMSLFSFGLAGVSIMGLPPSGGFTAKWLMLQSALVSGQWWWILVLVAGGLLTAVYIFRIYHKSFVDGPQQDVFRQPPVSLDILAFMLAAAAILLGLGAIIPLDFMAAAPVSAGGDR